MLKNKRKEREIAIVQVFENTELGKMRIRVNDDGNPMFALNDVCGVLGITNANNTKTRMRQGYPYIHTMEVGVVTGKKKNGTDAIQYIETTFIDESNLYRCIFQSRKPEAETFQNWIFDEVLPSIRKTGKYEVKKVIEHKPVNVIREIENNTLTMRGLIDCMFRASVNEIVKIDNAHVRQDIHSAISYATDRMSIILNDIEHEARKIHDEDVRLFIKQKIGGC